MGGPSAPQAYQPANQAGADAAYTQLLNANTANTQALYGYAQPQYEQIVSNVANNPYNTQAINGALDTSARAQPIGLDQIARGTQAGALNSGIIQSGFDPMSAMKNYQYGQVVDGAQARNAQAGLAGSPFGAGAVNDAATKFGLDWQAQQQQRQGAGVGQLATNNATANASQGQGLKTLEGAALLPQQTYDATQQQTLNALNQLVQALTGVTGSSNQTAGAAGAYLGIGQNATSIDQNAAKINSAGGGLLGGLGSILGMSSGGGGTVGGDLLSSIGLFA